MKGNTIPETSRKLSQTIVSFASNAGTGIITVPSSTVNNPGAWTQLSLLHSAIKLSLERAFAGKNENSRSKFGKDLAKNINDWFMNSSNQAVVNVIIPGSPPITHPGPSIPNTGNSAKVILENNLITLFNSIYVKNYMTTDQATKRLNNHIKKYFDSFKAGKQEVWTVGPVKGYLP